MSATSTSSPSPKPIPQPHRSSVHATRSTNRQVDLSSSPASVKSSRSSKLAQTPPYWNRHNRSISNVSYVSVNAPTRRPPILLEDHTEEQRETDDGLWAQGVKICEYHVVSGAKGAIGAGAYVVFHCYVDTLEVRPILW